jgi:hypothetical protein
LHVKIEISPGSRRVGVSLLASNPWIDRLHKVNIRKSKPRISDRFTCRGTLFQPVPFGRNADLPQGPSVMQLKRVGIADRDTSRLLHLASGRPTSSTLFHPKARGPTGIQDWVWCSITRTRLWYRHLSRVLMAPACFPRCADPFHYNDHSIPGGMAVRGSPYCRTFSAIRNRSKSQRRAGPGVWPL